MATNFKANQEIAAEKSNIEPIIDGLTYLKDEANREGFIDISEMVSNILGDIKSRKLTHETEIDPSITQHISGEINLPKVIELLNTFSNLNKEQIEALRKIVNLIQ